MAYATTEQPKRKPPLETTLRKLFNYAESENIAFDLDKDELEKLGVQVKRDYELDEESRREWKASADKAMDIALQVRQPKNYPFENASNIKYPLVTVAALQFGARAYPAIVDGNRIVKGAPLGEDDEQGTKRAKADRISQHMSYQLLYEMEDWEEDTDVLLHHLPIVGCAFRKVWRDGRLNRNKARMVPATRLVVNNAVQSLDDAQRVTDVVPFYPQEIEERQRSGEWLDVDLPLPQDAQQSDVDHPHDFLEQHRFLDLDDDGYREPYIVTVHKETNKVVRIVANYRVGDIVHDGSKVVRIPKRQYFVKYSFLRDPKGGYYDIGFGKLLESLSASIDTSINQMLDAGTLQNAGGGFIGSGLRLKQSQIRIKPGYYQYVEAPGSVIKDAIYHHEHPGPSAVSFSLLELLLTAAKDITGVKDILTGETGGKVIQPTTMLAMVEQGLKVFTSIYKRIWTSLRKEYKLLFELNAEYLSDQEYFTFLDNPQAISRQDYDTKSIDVMPVADPRMVTDMQKSARAQLLMELFPVVPNKGEALRRILDVAGEPNIDTLLQTPEDPMQQVMTELQIGDAMAEVEKKQASAMKDQAVAEKTYADIESDYRKDQIDVAKLTQEAERAGDTMMMDAVKHDDDMAMRERELKIKDKQASRKPVRAA